MNLFDYDQLPPLEEAEKQINIMTMDEVLTNINQGRARLLGNPDFTPPELESQIGILLIRRMRSMRSTSKGGKKKAASAPAGALTDLLGLQATSRLHKEEPR